MRARKLKSAETEVNVVGGLILQKSLARTGFNVRRKDCNICTLYKKAQKRCNDYTSFISRGEVEGMNGNHSGGFINNLAPM